MFINNLNLLIYQCYFCQFRSIIYSMSTEDFEVQNIHRYTRKTLKKNRQDDTETYYCHHENPNVEVVSTCTSPQVGSDAPGCSCSAHPDTELANILHKKCAVISLAQQQMQRLLNGTDILICDNSTRSVYDFLCKFKELLIEHDTTLLRALFALAFGFLIGLLLGSASCGTYLGQFESPILTCIDNMFASSALSKVEETLLCIA